MKDIRQIQMINKVFNNQKKMIINDILKLNSILKSKVDLVKKIQQYQREYESGNVGGILNVIPSLMNNKNVFTGKIFELVERENKEIDKINEKIKMKMLELSSVENKITSIESFERDYIEKKSRATDIKDQKEIDEIIKLRIMRNNDD
jgi:flagellar biosynthesis chaperone FliJ